MKWYIFMTVWGEEALNREEKGGREGERKRACRSRKRRGEERRHRTKLRVINYVLYTV